MTQAPGSSRRLAVLLALSMSAAACADEPVASQGPFDVGGTWSFWSQRSEVVCEASAELIQSAEMFSGTFTPHDDCRSIFDVFRNDMEGSITEGTVTDVEQDELFVVLEGRATIEIDGGPTLEVGPGDVCVLERGARTTWTVHEALRKVFQITLHDDGDA